jgi:hypothetical protein
MTEIERIDIDNLVIDSAQSRSQQSWGKDESDQQLVESVGEDGVMNPLMVRPVEMTPYDDDIDGDYSIVAGSRRFKASVSAGLSSVPCQVIEADDLEAAVRSLKENKERKDLTQRETMMSIKLQYEKLGGDDLKEEYECRRCGDVFDTSNGLKSHSSLVHDSEVKLGQSKSSVRTHEGAVAFISNTHYADIDDRAAKSKVRRMLDAVELPDEYLTLLTDSETRSQSERDMLDELGIEPGREFSLSNARGEFDAVIDLYNFVDSVDGVDADRRVLSAIGDIDLGQSNRNLSDRIDQIREGFAGEIQTINSPEEARKKFDESVNRTKQELKEIIEEVGTDGLGTVSLSFDEQRFKRYHALAKQKQKIEHDNEIVKQAYREYLKKQADKHGW